jgi:hypothetical protein
MQARTYKIPVLPLFPLTNPGVYCVRSGFRRGVVDRTNVSRDRRSPKLQQRCRNGREGRGTQSPARVAITWIAHGVRETADVPVRGKRRARPSKASGVGLVETAGRRSGDPPAKGRGFTAMPRDAGAGKRQTGNHPAERSQRTTPTRAKNRRVREALWPTQSAAEKAAPSPLEKSGTSCCARPQGLPHHPFIFEGGQRKTRINSRDVRSLANS